MRVIEIGDRVVDSTGSVRSMILIEATRDEIRAMPNLLYKEVEIKENGQMSHDEVSRVMEQTIQTVLELKRNGRTDNEVLGAFNLAKEVTK